MAETRDTPGSPTGRPPRTAWRWRIPAAAVLLAVTVGVGCAPWLLSAPGRMSRVAAALLPGLEGDVTFERVRVGWWGPIVLEGIRVTPRDGARPPLSIGRIEIENGLAAVLASRGDLGRVRTLGLQADIVFDDHRRSNISGIVRPAPRQEGPSSARSPRRSRVRMRLEVEAAIVRIDGPANQEPWQSGPIDVSATFAPTADGVGSEWIIDPFDIPADARLEPSVAKGVLAYIAPILAKTAHASGRFTLRLDGGRLPVGRPGDGTLAGTLELHEVVVGPGPVVEMLLALAPGDLPNPPEVRIADTSRVTFRMADRRVEHDGLEFGLPLGRAGQRLDVRSRGSVGIDEGDLDLTLQLPIPADLPQDRPVLAALAGKSLSFRIRGTLGAPQPVFDESIQDAAWGFAGDLIDRLQNGPAAENAADGDPVAGNDAADLAIDVLGGIIEGIAKRRAERREAESEGADPEPPRRLRDRRRGGRSREPAPGP